MSDAPHCHQAPSIAFQISAQPAMSTQMSRAELSFADAVHQFNTDDRDHCVAKLLEPHQHHCDALLDASMVLLNQVIEVFRRPQPLAVGREPSDFSSRTAR